MQGTSRIMRGLGLLGAGFSVYLVLAWMAPERVSAQRERDSYKKVEKYDRKQEKKMAGGGAREAGVEEKSEAPAGETRGFPEAGRERGENERRERLLPSRRLSPSKGFELFRIIVERNIFDPNREKERPAPPPGSESRPPAPPPMEFINLTGAMISERDEETSRATAVAFFEGSRSEYRGAWIRGMEIAGYRLEEIRNDRVKLRKDDRLVELFIGNSLGGRDKEKWELHDGPVPDGSSGSYSGSGGSESSSPVSSEPSTSPGSDSGDDSDLLRKMIERRRREMGQ